MRCPNCNSEVPEGKRFCGHCGHRLDPVVADVFDDEAPTRLYPSEPPQPMRPVQRAPVAAPLPVAPPPRKARGCLPRWAIGLMGGLGLVVVVAIVVVVLLALRDRGQEQAALSPTAVPTTAPALTPAPTPTPDIETLLIDAIDRANQAEIDAKRTLDTGVLEGNVTGDALEVQLARVEFLQNAGLYRASTQVSIEFLGFEVVDDGTHAQVETLEIWRDEVYQLADDVMMYRDLPEYVPQAYSLEMVEGQWLVENIEFYRDPDHFPLADGLEIVYELVEQRDRGQDVEATVVMLLVENNAGVNLATPFVFASFYDEGGEPLVHRQVPCGANPLEAGARALCRTTLTSDRENYPAGWQSYELWPVGVPTEDEPVAFTTVEVNLLEDSQGNPYITGWVRNDDDQNAHVYGIPIFYDEQGDPLEGTYATVAAEGGILEPGDAAAFQIVVSNGWDGSTYDLRWDGGVTGRSPRTGLAEEDVVREAAQIQGYLRNTSDDVEENVLIYGLFYDASYRLIGIRTNGEFIRTLSPGESEAFTVDFPSQLAEEDVDRFELIVW